MFLCLSPSSRMFNALFMLNYHTLYNDVELLYLLISLYNAVVLSYLLITVDDDVGLSYFFISVYTDVGLSYLLISVDNTKIVVSFDYPLCQHSCDSLGGNFDPNDIKIVSNSILTRFDISLAAVIQNYLISKIVFRLIVLFSNILLY